MRALHCCHVLGRDPSLLQPDSCWQRLPFWTISVASLAFSNCVPQSPSDGQCLSSSQLFSILPHFLPNYRCPLNLTGWSRQVSILLGPCTHTLPCWVSVHYLRGEEGNASKFKPLDKVVLPDWLAYFVLWCVWHGHLLGCFCLCPILFTGPLRRHPHSLLGCMHADSRNIWMDVQWRAKRKQEEETMQGLTAVGSSTCISRGIWVNQDSLYFCLLLNFIQSIKISFFPALSI